jgi:hypothetical protein
MALSLSVNASDFPITINTSVLDDETIKASVMTQVRLASAVLAKQVSDAHHKHSRIVANAQENALKRKLQTAFPDSNIFGSLDKGLSKISAKDYKLVEFGASRFDQKYDDQCCYINQRTNPCTEPHVAESTISVPNDDNKTFCYCGKHYKDLTEKDDVYDRQVRLLARAIKLYKDSIAPSPQRQESSVIVEDVTDELPARRVVFAPRSVHVAPVPVPVVSLPVPIPVPQIPFDSRVPMIEYDPNADLDLVQLYDEPTAQEGEAMDTTD